MPSSVRRPRDPYITSHPSSLPSLPSHPLHPSITHLPPSHILCPLPHALSPSHFARGNFATPDAYWDQPELEGLYVRIAKEFEIGRRVSLLNQKLDYAHELVQVRNAQLGGNVHLRYSLESRVLVDCFA